MRMSMVDYNIFLMLHLNRGPENKASIPIVVLEHLKCLSKSHKIVDIAHSGKPVSSIYSLVLLHLKYSLNKEFNVHYVVLEHSECLYKP